MQTFSIPFAMFNFFSLISLRFIGAFVFELHLLHLTHTRQVNGSLWDMTRPFEGDADLVIFKADAPEAKEVFRHSGSGWPSPQFCAFFFFINCPILLP